MLAQREKIRCLTTVLFVLVLLYAVFNFKCTLQGKEGKKVYTTSTKQYLIMQVPPVLILHLKRFQMQRRGFNKLNKHVEFPLLLDLAPVCKGITKPKIYALYGVVVHLGTCSGGHYVSYVKVICTIHFYYNI